MRRIHGVVGLLLVTPLALAARCGFEPVRILEPVSGSVLTCMPFTVVLDLAPEVDTQTIELQFDGLESFGEVWLEEVTEGGSRIRATADFVWAAGLDCSSPGIQPHELVASALGSGLRTFRSRSFDTVGDAYADDAPSFSIGNGGGFNQGLLPGIVTGAAVGGGLFAASLDVVSLGQSGSIDLAFTDNVIVDGPGVDFTVFENAFLELGVGFTTLPPFSEPGRVSVSQDGVLWFAFPCSLDIVDAPYYPGCAGVYPTLANGDADPPHPAVPTFGPPIEDLVGLNALTMTIPEGSGGDSFDLADVGLTWARWVRIDGADFVDGPVGPNNFGFDLDAAAAVNSVPATDLDMNGIPDAVE